MHRYKEAELIEQGYRIENAEITSVDLSMEDHGCLTFDICLSGNGWGICYGGYCLGKGYLNANDEFFKGSSSGMKAIMMILDTIGVSKLSYLKGKIVRVATKSWGESIKIIGNVLEDKWFDYESFFKDEHQS